jgi:hypothetical protein
VTIGNAGRYDRYVNRIANDQQFDGPVYSSVGLGVGRFSNSTQRTAPFAHMGSCGREVFNKQYVSPEAAKQGYPIPAENPASTYLYSCHEKQVDSTKVSKPKITFPTDYRAGLEELFADQLAGETVVCKVGSLQRCHTEFTVNIEGKHMDAYAHPQKCRAPIITMTKDRRHPLAPSCSPGPAYGDVMEHTKIGTGPAFSTGTSQREKRAFNSERDMRPYNDFMGFGSPSHASRTTAGYATQGRSFARNSSRKAPVMTKLDKNW